jgi:hypothetical protein
MRKTISYKMNLAWQTDDKLFMFPHEERRLARDQAVYHWELASGKCLNRIVGTGDLRTIVDGGRNMDHWLISRASQLVAEDARDGSRLAGTAATMQRVLCSPDRRTWATLAGGDRAQI